MALNKTQSALSTELVQIKVAVTVNGAPYNPSSDVVAMAFMPSGTNPTTSDWKTGSWQTDPGPTYWAQCLVGPANGGVVLAVGSYVVWLKIVDNPEVPVRQVGILQIV